MFDTGRTKPFWVSNLAEKDKDSDTYRNAKRARKGCRYVINNPKARNPKRKFYSKRQNCNKKYGFVCKKPDFYMAKGEAKPKVFRVSEELRTMTSAEESCNEWGGTLVKIVGNWQKGIFLDLLGQTSDFWIGPDLRPGE